MATEQRQPVREQETRLTVLLDHGQEEGCLDLSKVGDLIRDLGLDEGQVDDLYSEAKARGIVLSDDCAREGVPEATYDHDTLASVTTDALRLFLNELRKHPLLTVEEEVDLAKRIERGDKAAKGEDDHVEPASRRVERGTEPISLPCSTSSRRACSA